MDIKYIVKVCFFIGVLNAIAQDGIMLPMDDDSHGSNKCVHVKLVLAKDDPTLPQWTVVYRPQSDFIATGDVAKASVKVDGKIRIENDTDWPYVFGRQCMRSGYYSLEFDLMMDNGNIIVMRRRRPELLHEDGSVITVKPHRQWESLVSFDRRLWEFSAEISTNKVKKIRPRFAFGAYNVEGTYYRTIDEIKNARKNHRHFDDRDGELVGDWIDSCFDKDINAGMTTKYGSCRFYDMASHWHLSYCYDCICNVLSCDFGR